MRGMSTPSLQSVPQLERLLAPEEFLIYTARFSVFRGWKWLFAGTVLWCAAAVWQSWGLVLPGAVFLGIWVTPFITNELAISNKRLMLRVGDFYLRTEAIPSERLESWSIRQNLISSFFHSGTVIIHVKEGMEMRKLIFRWLKNPITFTQALETLQPELQIGNDHD
jgi:hypothetical protein